MNKEPIIVIFNTVRQKPVLTFSQNFKIFKKKKFENLISKIRASVVEEKVQQVIDSPISVLTEKKLRKLLVQVMKTEKGKQMICDLGDFR